MNEIQINDYIAQVDLDGTLADYDKSLQAELRKLMSPGEIENPPGQKYDEALYMEARRKLIQAKSGFWLNLEKIQLGFDIVDELIALGFEIQILTKGPKGTPSAWSEKFLWCQKHIPDAKVTITQDKSVSYGRVLVDDYPPYFEGWLANRPRGLVICVAQPWNEHVVKPDYRHYGRVLRYDGANLGAIKIALRMAKERPSGQDWFGMDANVHEKAVSVPMIIEAHAKKLQQLVKEHNELMEDAAIRDNEAYDDWLRRQ